MTSAETLTQLRDRVHSAFPDDLDVSGPFQSSGKTVLFHGRLGGRPVVVKVLTDQNTFWRDRFAAEVATYRTFQLAPPPVPVPELLGADPDAGVLIMTRLPGIPIATDRYPEPLTAPLVELLVDTAATVRTWHAPPGLFASVFDYPARYARYRNLGLLDQADGAALTALTRVAAPQEMAHGDLLPANVLHQPAASTTQARVTGVLDFEFTGLFLPCFDLALLWVLLSATPHARARIEAAIGTDTKDAAGFWINVAMVTTRELRTHAELEPGHPLREVRLAQLAETWAQARLALYDTARQA